MAHDTENAGEADKPGLGAATAQPVAGTWVASDPPNAFLTFEPQDATTGSMRGGDGCNGLGGTYTVDGDTATIERGFGTLMFCPGVDDWLRKTASVRVDEVDGTTLHVLNRDGHEIGTLARAV